MFNKTQSSAKTYSKEAVKEELQIASNNVYVDDTSTNTTNTMIADSMIEELKDINWQSKEKSSGTYKGYPFYIDANHNVIMEELYLGIPTYISNTNSLTRSNVTAFSTYRESIKNIIIKEEATPKYSANALDNKKWDVSKARDNSILAYLKTNKTDNTLYDLYIVSTGKIIMPEISTSFFFNL